MTSSQETNEFFSWLQTLEKDQDRNGELWVERIYVEEDCDGAEPPICRMADFVDHAPIEQAQVIMTKLGQTMTSEIRKTVDFVVRAYNIGGDAARLMQAQLQEVTSLSEHKISVICSYFLIPILESAKWAESMDLALQKCYDVLAFIQGVYDASCQHSKTDVAQTLIHFQAKEYLGRVCCNLWSLFAEKCISGVDHDVFIPSLRRLL